MQTGGTLRMVTHQADNDAVMDDLRRKMERLDGFFPPELNKVSGNPDK